MFPYRNDNVQRPINLLVFKTNANEIEFELRFQINEVAFCSRLNEEMMSKMKTSSYFLELVDVVKKDYLVSKR
jgi:hypothetical protein